MHVGTKELKNRLSHYLRLVANGDFIQVTDRGKIVAELRPVYADPSSEAEALRDLEAEGLMVIGTGAHEDFSPLRMRKRNAGSAAVIEDRR
ncbi:MAG: hypothetical protein HY791_24815 [Deltaproteobacteria bacterium]|nr:hypothetical protein [Deltaproteobacteria bacterium]